jgi:hypothetical protein
MRANPPLKISIMLACYYATWPDEVIGHAAWNSPAGRQFRQELFADDLINENCKATVRGKLWVDRICNTALPDHEVKA